MTIPHKERIRERYFAENCFRNDSNTGEGTSSDTLASTSQIYSRSPKKNEVTPQEVSQNADCQPCCSSKNTSLEEEQEQNNLKLDERDLTLYDDHKEVIETMPSTAEKYEVNDETVSFQLKENEENNSKKKVDEILVGYDELVLKRIKEIDNLQNESDKANNLLATSKCDAVAFVENQHFKHEFEPERPLEYETQPKGEQISQTKGNQREKSYKNDEDEVEKNRALLNSREKDRRAELRELLKNLQLCIPTVAGATKHVSQERVMTEARKLIEFNRTEVEDLLKKIAALETENQKLHIKYEKLNAKFCANK